MHLVDFAGKRCLSVCRDLSLAPRPPAISPARLFARRFCWRSDSLAPLARRPKRRPSAPTRRSKTLHTSRSLPAACRETL